MTGSTEGTTTRNSSEVAKLSPSADTGYEVAPEFSSSQNPPFQATTKPEKGSFKGSVSLRPSPVGPSRFEQSLVEQSRRSIQKGSKSFSLASWMLPEGTRPKVWLLYSFCRWADDQIDSTEEGDQSSKDSSSNLAPLSQTLSNLRKWIDVVYSGSPLPSDSPEPILGLESLLKSSPIPKRCFLDLLSGFQRDSEGAVIETENDLDLYCYQVAGVVGVMMCHVLGLQDPKAFPHAMALGQAMQLSNILRDVNEDWDRGRFYFPTQWIHRQAPSKALWPVLVRTWEKSEILYQKGLAGLIYLPLRTAIAIDFAAHVYQRIGRKVMDRGPSQWQERAYTKRREKFFIFLSLVPKWILWTLVPQQRRFGFLRAPNKIAEAERRARDSDLTAWDAALIKQPNPILVSETGPSTARSTNAEKF